MDTTSVIHDELELPNGPVQNGLAETGIWIHTLANSLLSLDAQLSAPMPGPSDDEGLSRIQTIFAREIGVARIALGQIRAQLQWNSTASRTAPLEVSQTIVAQAMSSVVDRIAAHPVTIGESSELPPVLADHRCLVEAIVGLIENAIAAAESSQTTAVEIVFGVVDDWVTIDIVDHGPGLSESEAKRWRQRPDGRGRSLSGDNHAHELGAPTSTFGSGQILYDALISSWGGALVLLKSSQTGATFRIWLKVSHPQADARAFDLLAKDYIDEFAHLGLLNKEIAFCNVSQEVSEYVSDLGLEFETVVDIGELDSTSSMRSSSIDLLLVGIFGDSSEATEAMASIARLRQDGYKGIIISLRQEPFSEHALEALEHGIDRNVVLGSDDYSGVLTISSQILSGRALDGDLSHTSVLSRMADIAHELRSPTVAVQRIAEGLARGVGGGTLEDRQMESVNSIVGLCQRQSELLDSHVRLAQEASHRGIQRNPIPCDVEQLLRDQVDRVAAMDESARSRIRISTTLTDPILLPEGYLEIALEPLFNNAVIHSEPGSDIVVRATRDTSHVIVVIDNQALPGRSVDHVGRGLGLGLARRLLEERHGNLFVQPGVGLGYRVVARLPITFFDETEESTR